MFIAHTLLFTISAMMCTREHSISLAPRTEPCEFFWGFFCRNPHWIDAVYIMDSGIVIS
ncbi:hypothetical protein M758_12G076100 [Ceratodon purpureus]|nr:hypothetical protein M758_12G076100 [Ceratodon purpureus]